jgi:hypothetical protein
MIQWCTSRGRLEFEKRCYYSRAAYGWRKTIGCTHRCSILIRYLHKAVVIYRYPFNPFLRRTILLLHNTKTTKKVKELFPFLHLDSNRRPTRQQAIALPTQPPWLPKSRNSYLLSSVQDILCERFQNCSYFLCKWITAHCWVLCLNSFVNWAFFCV